MEGDRLAEFAVESKLGEGSFSCVYKVRRIDDGQLYAMKKVKIGQMREKEKENALNEVRILASITHPNIVNYRDAFFDDRTQTLCVVMELADAGDIQKKVNDHTRHGTHFNEAEVWQALIQMTRGLKALHQINILHRDLKCANVFCTSDRRYKLGDLNVSKVAKRGMARTQTGTPYYTSPEVWNDRPYDAKCDIWSLGCVIYEMVTLKPPFRANNLKELYAKIQKGIYEPLPKFYSEDLRTVLGLCLKVLPTQRISAVDLLQHPSVLRNMSASEIQLQNNSQTSKCNLLKTIMVPKNLKSLKQALPASKYEQPNSSNSQQADRKFRRANSANQLRSQIPQVIASPKAGVNNDLLKYALLRRPSQQQPKRELHSDRVEESRPAPRMERNNSLELLRKRIESNQSIDSSRRKEASREIPKELPRPISRDGKEVPVPRPVSRDGLAPRQPSKMIKEIPKVEPIRYNSRERANSRDGSRERANSREGRQGMEQISNRCRQIQERVKVLMDRKREQKDKEKEQRNPNLPVIRQPLVKEIKYNYQRPVSRDRQDRYSRNKSIELARQQSSASKQADSKRSLERPSSRERLASLERGSSRDSGRRAGVIRYGY